MPQMNVQLAESSNLGLAGTRVNLELTPSDVRDPAEIPSYLAGYKNGVFRADEASKIILVDKDEDKFRTFSSDDAFLPVRVKGALSGPVPEIDPSSSLDTYKVVDRYIGSFVNPVTEAQAQYSLRMAAARRCQRALDLDRELDLFGASGILTTAGNWAAAQRQALGLNENWNGGSTSNPITNIQDSIIASAQAVNEIWMNQEVAFAFIRHSEVRDHMRQLLGDGPASSIAQGLAGSASGNGVFDFIIPGLPPIKVSNAKYKNSSGVIVYVMPSVAVLLTSPPGVPMDGEEIATSYTFRRRGPSGVGWTSREFTVEGRGPEGGTMIVVATADVIKMTGNTCGGIITGIIA